MINTVSKTKNSYIQHKTLYTLKINTIIIPKLNQNQKRFNEGR